MKTASLGDLCEVTVGRTPARANPEYWGEGAHWLSIADMNQGLDIWATKEQITAAGAAAGRRVEPGTVLFSFKLSIGKVAVSQVPLYTNEAIAALPIRDPRSLDSRYLLRALQAMNFDGSENRAAMGLVLNKAKVQELSVPVPPIEEQRRIAAILDQADAIRAKRRQILTQLDALTVAVFDACFPDSGSATAIPLGEIATVSSGITKGRRANAETRPVPYLAVSNVQSGRLALNKVSSIEATDAEIEKFALTKGDLVLTEGGDPDKLGRGTVWRGELPLAIHQNHIFRVRPSSGVLSEYLSAYMASRRARAYFFRSAKQTTGIATINMAQLRALPVVLPPMTDQERYRHRLAGVVAHRAAVERALSADDELFASLQSRAFRGEL